jgi:hypothetical protein
LKALAKERTLSTVRELSGTFLVSFRSVAFVVLVLAHTPAAAANAHGSELQQFSLAPSSVVVWPVNLNQGDQLSGSLSITGGSGNDINFWITDPSGGPVVNQGRVSQGTSFAFTASASGGYTFHFDNSYSLFSGKVVTLTYNIASSVVTSLTLVVVGAAIAGLVALIAYVTKFRKKGATETIPRNPKVS